MKTAFHAGATGLLAYQNALNTIGNNIANVNTNGFRGQDVSFENLLYTEMKVNADTNPLVGNGVKMVLPTLRTEQGNFKETGSLLDFGIAGKGMFAVEKNGQIQYTRDGAFYITQENGEGYLTTLNGAYVLDENYNRIQLDIDEESGIYDYSSVVDRLAVFQFDNEQGMTPVSGNCFLATENSGNAYLAQDGTYKIMVGYLEQSNVDLSDEMVEMITAQRSFQVSSRVLQVADENEQTVNQLRR